MIRMTESVWAVQRLESSCSASCHSASQCPLLLSPLFISITVRFFVFCQDVFFNNSYTRLKVIRQHLAVGQASVSSPHWAPASNDQWTLMHVDAQRHAWPGSRHSLWWFWRVMIWQAAGNLQVQVNLGLLKRWSKSSSFRGQPYYFKSFNTNFVADIQFFHHLSFSFPLLLWRFAAAVLDRVTDLINNKVLQSVQLYWRGPNLSCH